MTEVQLSGERRETVDQYWARSLANEERVRKANAEPVEIRKGDGATPGDDWTTAPATERALAAGGPGAKLLQLEIAVQRAHPHWTRLACFSAVRNTPEGKALHRQLTEDPGLAAALRGFDPRTLSKEVHTMKQNAGVSLPSVIAKAASSGQTIRELATQAILDGGAALRMHDRSLTKAEAVAKFAFTAEGRELYAWSTAADAGLTVAEYRAIEKRRDTLRESGAADGSWSAMVTRIAKGVTVRDDVDFLTALRTVAGERPDMWDCAQHERRGR